MRMANIRRMASACTAMLAASHRGDCGVFSVGSVNSNNGTSLWRSVDQTSYLSHRRGRRGHYQELSCQCGEVGNHPPDNQETHEEGGPQQGNAREPLETRMFSGERQAGGLEPDLSGTAFVTTPDFHAQRAQGRFDRASTTRTVDPCRSAGGAMSGDQDASTRRFRTSIRPSVRVVPGSRR
jgi:hypothetical protein